MTDAPKAIDLEAADQLAIQQPSSSFHKAQHGMHSQVFIGGIIGFTFLTLLLLPLLSDLVERRRSRQAIPETAPDLLQAHPA